MEKNITFLLNGKEVNCSVQPNKFLVELIRGLGLTGTKHGCGQGECGACTVLLDGQNVDSCLILAVEVDGRKVTTIEGMEKNGDLSAVQQAFSAQGAVQCGFCTPGMVLSAESLLNENPTPNEAEIREAMSGNLCRCTGYTKIIQAVQQAAVVKQEEGAE